MGVLTLHIHGIVGVPLRLRKVRRGTVAVPEVLALAGPRERHTTAIPALVGLAAEEEGRVLKLVFWDIRDFGESELFASASGIKGQLPFSRPLRTVDKTGRNRRHALVEISRPWQCEDHQRRRPSSSQAGGLIRQRILAVASEVLCVRLLECEEVVRFDLREAEASVVSNDLARISTDRQAYTSRGQA
jgi:hypothetical protein